MKRKISLVLGLILLGVLGWYSYVLVSGRGRSDQDVAAFNFEIKDTARVDKIIITEPSGMEMTVVRNGKNWTDKNGNCVQYQLVNNVLDAAYNAHFKGYVPENSMKNVTTRMATTGTKVQFFMDGEWHKTWYIGTATPDHTGTYMLVESDEFGKSDLPVIMELQNMKGIIGPRFFAEPRKWECTGIFAYEMHEIASVDVKFNDNPSRSFTVKSMGKRYSVAQNGRPLPAVDTSMVTRYLSSYKRINFELPNYELSPRQVDSLKHSKPFCTLTVQTKNGATSKLKMYRKKSDSGEEEVNDWGETVTYDINRFWCVLPSGNVVKCQYFVFNPLLMGHVYFGYQRPAPVK